jgi:hypothetical protein
MSQEFSGAGESPKKAILEAIGNAQLSLSGKIKGIAFRFEVVREWGEARIYGTDVTFHAVIRVLP